MSFFEILPPSVLFFALGFAAAALRSDLSVPDALAKTLSLYLMMAIGLKGGIAIAQPGASSGLIPALILGIALSAFLPLPAYGLLRAATPLDKATAAAVSAHYGSVSVVTFAAAVGQLNATNTPYEGFMPAVLAAMETPAILTALLIARRGGAATSGGAKEMAREVFLNGSVVLLLGGAAADRQLAPFITALFPGALCLFLLEMGITAARRLRDRGRGLDARLIGFAVLMPLIGGAAGLAGGVLIGLSTGGVGLMAVLGASASYIAVPAAMRLALPSADAGIYVTLSSAITFPFNVLAGIPLWLWAARLATQ